MAAPWDPFTKMEQETTTTGTCLIFGLRGSATKHAYEACYVWTRYSLWTIHDSHISPMTTHQYSPAQAFSVIAHVSVEVHQQNYRVSRWHHFQNTTHRLQGGWVFWTAFWCMSTHNSQRLPPSDLQSHRGDPLVPQGKLQHCTGKELVSMSMTARHFSP